MSNPYSRESGSMEEIALFRAPEATHEVEKPSELEALDNELSELFPEANGVYAKLLPDPKLDEAIREKIEKYLKLLKAPDAGKFEDGLNAGDDVELI
jgi:hypothetical protein